MAFEIIGELVIDDIGGQHQGQLAQFRKSSGAWASSCSSASARSVFGGASTISISSALLMNEIGHRLGHGLPVIASTWSRSSAMY